MTDDARARNLPPGWRPEWREPRSRAHANGTPEELAKRLEAKRQLREQANQLLAERGKAGKTLVTTGAPWLDDVSDEPVRPAIFRRLSEFDSTLVPLGHRALSDAWRAVLERWLCQSEAMTLTVRKGRRIGASTIIAPRLIVAWVLTVVPRIQLPPGEQILVGLVSVKRGEASNRIAQISAVLTALGIAHVSRAQEIELSLSPVKICVLTRNWKSAVGENIGLLWCDEVSRWESEESSSNPAAEVVGSLKPALATLAVDGMALMCLISSPWSEDDYHAQQYAKGDTEDQTVAFLPTWIGRPDITEEQTHRLERDDRIWSREYAAIPGNVLSQALDSDDVNAAFGMVVPAGDLRRWCCIDASSLRGDAFAWHIGHEARGGLVIDEVHGFDDMSLRSLTLDTVVDEISMRCRQLDIKTVWGDQREEAGLETLFRQQRLVFESFAWTNQSKHEAFTFLRRLLRDRRVQLVEHAQLRTQMRQCKARLAPSGMTVYETNGLDYLSTLITLLHAYQRNWPDTLAQIIAGRYVPAPVSAEEALEARNRADAERYLREAKKRAAAKAKAIWKLR
jgi:hypothetical protein